MLEKSIVEFLEQVTVERKPLSEDERKEAMKVAKKVWAKAMGKANGKSYSLFVDHTPTYHRIALWTGKSIENFKPENPKTDLVIVIEGCVRVGEKFARANIINTYYFAPDNVTKKIEDQRGWMGDRLRRDILTFEPESLKRGYERRTEERLHPDKADLEGVLSSLSSARFSMSR